LGIDHSTQTLAFCLSIDGVPEYWEEISLKGSTAFERVGDLYGKLAARFDNEQVDILVIEKTARVNSLDTAIKLGFVAGVIIGYFANKKVKVFEAPALSWQAATAKPTLSKADKLALRAANPKRSKSWYSNEERKIRKQRIIDWVYENFGMLVPSDCADAICISVYGSRKL